MRPSASTRACSTRLRLLAANIGGIPEQVQEGVTGRLFAPDSVEALAAGLQEMWGP